MREMFITRRMRVAGVLTLAPILFLAISMLRRAPHGLEGSPLTTVMLLFLPASGLIFTLWIAMDLSEHTIGHSLLRVGGNRYSLARSRMGVLFQLLVIALSASVLLGFAVKFMAPPLRGEFFVWQDLAWVLQLSTTSILSNLLIALLVKRVSTTLFLGFIAHLTPFILVMLKEFNQIPGMLNKVLPFFPGVSLWSESDNEWLSVISILWIVFIGWGCGRTWMKMEIA